MYLLGNGPYCTCCINPDLYSVVYNFKLFQIETINREYSFLPTGQVWWANKFFPSGTCAILETPPLFPWGEGGGGVEWISVNFEFRGFCLLLIFVASEEPVLKQLSKL